MASSERFRLVTLRAARHDLAADVSAGLGASPKTLPCKYFYDEAGSRLFEQICELPEYYLPRVESSILQRYARDIVRLADPHTLVELGCGNSKKTCFLIDACLARRPALTFCGIDIEPECLQKGARRLTEQYLTLRAVGLVGEFTDGMAYLSTWDESGSASLGAGASKASARANRPLADSVPRLVAFLGSTIGNFDPAALDEFVAMLHRFMRGIDRLLLGADLLKDRAELIAAYDDPAGVTAQFNLNLLHRINRELGADFDPAGFRHEARFNSELGRIEMHLVSTRRQTVRVGSERFEFARDETIHTENCHKFSLEGMSRVLRGGGFEVIDCFTDPESKFCLFLARPTGVKLP